MMPAGRGRGLGEPADEGGWGVIYSKLNRGLSWKPTNRKNVMDLGFDRPLLPPFLAVQNSSIGDLVTD